MVGYRPCFGHGRSCWERLSVAVLFSQSAALAQPKPRFPRFPIVGTPDRAPVDLKRDWDMLKGRSTPEQTTNLTNSPADELGPQWSGDDRFIYFYSNRVSATNGARGNNFRIYVMRPDGTDIRQVTTEDGDQIEPALSLNQNRLAYVARASAAAPYHLFVRNLTTGAVLSLTRERTDLPFTEVRQPLPGLPVGWRWLLLVRWGTSTISLSLTWTPARFGRLLQGTATTWSLPGRRMET